MNQLDLFRDTLPRSPYATDDFKQGLYRLPKVEALTRRFIQTNPDRLLYWLAYDVDRPGGAHDWQLRECPPPSISVENPVNLHAHLLYGLGLPVLKAPEENTKALRYAAAVEQGLRVKLDADPSYSAFTCKNPLCDYWHVETWQENLYDLAWLSDYVDLTPYRDRRRNIPTYGLGRNCALFENLRRWSYRAIREMNWPDLDTWRRACLEKAVALNTFPAPLPFQELRSTARSVSGWTWRTFSPEAFSAIQRARAIKGQAASAAVRGEKARRKVQLLLDFPGFSVRSIAKITGIPRSTVHRLKVSHLPISVLRDPGRVESPPVSEGRTTKPGKDPARA